MVMLALALRIGNEVPSLLPGRFSSTVPDCANLLWLNCNDDKSRTHSLEREAYCCQNGLLRLREAHNHTRQNVSLGHKKRIGRPAVCERLGDILGLCDSPVMFNIVRGKKSFLKSF